MSDDHFIVKIENPGRNGRLPTYAVLGEAKIDYYPEAHKVQWGLEDTLRLIRESEVKPRCIFILIANQQTPSVGFDEQAINIAVAIITRSQDLIDHVIYVRSAVIVVISRWCAIDGYSGIKIIGHLI